MWRIGKLQITKAVVTISTVEHQHPQYLYVHIYTQKMEIWKSRSSLEQLELLQRDSQKLQPYNTKLLLAQMACVFVFARGLLALTVSNTRSCRIAGHFRAIRTSKDWIVVLERGSRWSNKICQFWHLSLCCDMKHIEWRALKVGS